MVFFASLILVRVRGLKLLHYLHEIREFGFSLHVIKYLIQTYLRHWRQAFKSLLRSVNFLLQNLDVILLAIKGWCDSSLEKADLYDLIAELHLMAELEFLLLTHEVFNLKQSLSLPLIYGIPDLLIEYLNIFTVLLCLVPEHLPMVLYSFAVLF